jgi:hypothetical protein
MHRRRTTATRIFVLLPLAAACALLLLVAAASAGPVPKPLVFPLIGPAELTDSWGDARANGRHAGEDIMAPRRAAVVAAEAGRVKWHRSSWRAGCMLYLYGRSGTTYLYIHLNNDLTLRNDNRGGCEAGTTYTVADGARVQAGEQIAWNGDSGDADGNPHLHFEVHPNNGPDVDPHPYLLGATRHLFPARAGKKTTVAVRGKVLAAGGGTIDVEATSVRWWPNGRWTAIAPFPVRFALAPDVQVDPAFASLVGGAASRTTTGVRSQVVRVVSTAAPATLEMMRGTSGSLVAARVTAP